MLLQKYVFFRGPVHVPRDQIEVRTRPQLYKRWFVTPSAHAQYDLFYSSTCIFQGTLSSHAMPAGQDVLVVAEEAQIPVPVGGKQYFPGYHGPRFI